MSYIENLFDALYYQFVLKDLFGKIIPGLLFLSVMAISQIPPTEFFIYVAFMKNWWFWLITLGIAWIIAFSIQSFGEKFNLIRYFPCKGEDKECIAIAHQKLRQFNKYAPKIEWQIVERYRLIMESCGNSYLTLSISLMLIFVDGILDAYAKNEPIIPWIIDVIYDFGLLFFVIIGIIWFLRRMHFEHVKRSYNYMEEFLKEYEAYENDNNHFRYELY